MDKAKLIEINELLNLLSLHGGEIVCSASLDTNDINQAKASGRMAVTENNIGFVWMPKFKFPTTDKEVEFFEKWFPLDVEMPDKFNDADYVQKNIIDKVSLTAPAPDGKEYQIDFGNHLRCKLNVTDNQIKVEGAVNGWGNGVPLTDIVITELTKTPDAG